MPASLAANGRFVPAATVGRQLAHSLNDVPKRSTVA